MRKGPLILLLSAALGGTAQAQSTTHYNCSDGLPGFSTCRDSNGDTYRVQKDEFGTTVTDNHGNRARIRDDGLGGTIIQDNSGRQTHIQSDGLGGNIIRAPDGSVVHERTDAFGNTTYQDQQGHQTRCRRSPYALPGQTEEDCQ
jgi:hypothetical protein